MKKFFSLIAVLMLVMAMLPTSAMAYEAVSITNNEFQHILTLTGALRALEAGTKITYEYAVESTPTVLYKPDNFDVSKAVTGTPEVYFETQGNNSVVFDNSSTFENGVCKKTMTVDWTGVTITEPGIYVWKVTKTCDEANTVGTAGEHSKEPETLYVYAIVTTEANALKCVSGVAITEDLTTKGGSMTDSYPVRKLSLTIKKEVSGDMASVEQYFPFTISLTTLPGDYTITGIEETTKVTAYNATTHNNAKLISVDTTTNGSVTIWMKHGQTAVIEGLPYGSHYVISEGDNAGFDEVSITVSGDQDVKKEVAFTVEDELMTADTDITYTNKKSAPVPTGIVLETAAPMMGILLAMSMLAVLYIGKRKESAV